MVGIVIGPNRHHDYLIRNAVIGWKFETDFELEFETYSERASPPSN